MRRTALFIEESLYRGTQWVVFEPNDEPLWAQIRLNVGAFMHDLFRQGAFQGTTPREAYFVKCDSETTTQNDINLGIVNILVGFAPLKPAEFVDHQDPADRRPDPGLSAGGARMAQFTVNAHRFDPYKNFKFRVKWDGRYVAGRQQGQRAQAHDRGGQAPRGRRPEQQPQVARAAPSSTRSRSSAASPTTREFEQWANKVWNFGAGLGAEVSLKDFRKDIIIEVYNEAGQLALAYNVFRCWVSEYQALPDLDANANAVAIQHIKLENEGWERDVEVAEPAEPTFTEPRWRRGRGARDAGNRATRRLGDRGDSPPVQQRLRLLAGCLRPKTRRTTRCASIGRARRPVISLRTCSLRPWPVARATCPHCGDRWSRLDLLTAIRARRSRTPTNGSCSAGQRLAIVPPADQRRPAEPQMQRRRPGCPATPAASAA